MKRRVMVVGSSGAGKTSLLVSLNLTKDKVKKTEMVHYSDQSIDIPGEYLDNRLFGLIEESARKAALLLFVLDPTRSMSFPPRLNLALKVRSLGVITKKDRSSDMQRTQAQKKLFAVGIKEVMECSSLTGEGIQELSDRIQQILREQTR